MPAFDLSTVHLGLELVKSSSLLTADTTGICLVYNNSLRAGLTCFLVSILVISRMLRI